MITNYGTVKQAEPITEKEEGLLWDNGLLGDHTPQALLNTVVYMIGLYFALRIGREHRELRFTNTHHMHPHFPGPMSIPGAFNFHSCAAQLSLI